MMVAMGAAVAATSAHRIHPAAMHVQRWEENGAAPSARRQWLYGSG